MKHPAWGVALGCIAATLAGCLYRASPHQGGGKAEVDANATRAVEPRDVLVPPGYRAEVVATGLRFPTGVAFDAENRPWVVEAGYSYGEVFSTPRLLRIDDGGRAVEVARGDRNGPWTGLAFADGAFWVAEGGQGEGGKLLRVTPAGEVRAVLEDLVGKGDHHTNGPVAGPDGWIYFGQGTTTNSGVVGEDSAQYGWLRRHSRLHDVPCSDVTLAGRNFETADVVSGAGTVETGAFVPFGTRTEAGQVVKGAIPCSGAVLRVRPEGGTPELVAWGFRNPFGLAFDGRGQLWVTDNGYDVRGSRPVFGAPDLLWRVERGTWYGWPDFTGGQSLEEDRWAPPGGKKPGYLLAKHPNVAPEAQAYLGVNSSSNGLDFSSSERFGHVGEAFIAQFGDLTPATGKVMSPVGFKVVRVEPETGVTESFVANRGKENGPASRIGGAGLERPVAVRFDRTGEVLYVVDFGIVTVGEQPEPREGTGVLWRVLREGPAR